MEHFFSVLLKIFGFIAVIVIVIILFNIWLKHKERSWAFLLKQDNNKALAPLRISAYERIVVMLERIAPQSLVMRHNTGNASAASMQMEMIRSLREEFDHNISLQMYVSQECWEKVKRAKEETSELVKVAFTRVKPDSSSLELSREILQLEAKVGNSAIREALLGIRIEMQKYF